MGHDPVPVLEFFSAIQSTCLHHSLLSPSPQKKKITGWWTVLSTLGCLLPLLPLLRFSSYKQTGRQTNSPLLGISLTRTSRAMRSLSYPQRRFTPALPFLCAIPNVRYTTPTARGTWNDSSVRRRSRSTSLRTWTANTAPWRCRRASPV